MQRATKHRSSMGRRGHEVRAGLCWQWRLQRGWHRREQVEPTLAGDPRVMPTSRVVHARRRTRRRVKAAVQHTSIHRKYRQPHRQVEFAPSL